MDEIIKILEKSDPDTAKAIKVNLEVSPENVEYLHIKQPFTDSGALGKTEVKRFNVTGDDN